MSTDLPSSVLASLGDYLTRQRPSAYLRIDAQLRVTSTSGALSAFGLEQMRIGDDPRERLVLLEGILPPDEPVIHVPQVTAPSGLVSDLFVGSEGDDYFAVLLDATPSADNQRAQQQPHNASALLAQSPALQQPIFGEVLNRLRVCVLVPQRGTVFRVIGPGAQWLSEVVENTQVVDLVDSFPYLEYFLEDAREHWASGDAAGLRSDYWTQSVPSGGELHFQAIAIPSSRRENILIIQQLDEAYRERQELLQQARGHQLLLDERNRENNKKDVLLGCIVHDLQGPLSAMMGSLSLLQGQSLADERRDQVVGIGLSQARRQREMIQRILEVFAADLEALESFETSASTAPDLLESIARTAKGFRTAFEERRISLAVPPPPYPQLPVVGRADRLDRVIANLLGNALAHSPIDTEVTLSWHDEGPTVRVDISDEGPGVSEEVRETLFDRFVSAVGPRVGGGTGLGLYFCRTVVEQWFGQIGYEANEPRGSRFWFRLRRAT